MNRLTVRLPDDLGAVPKPGYGWPEIADRLAAYEDAEKALEGTDDHRVD